MLVKNLSEPYMRRVVTIRLILSKSFMLSSIGELKSSKASELLKVYSASTDVTLAEEAKLSAALCGGKSHKRISGKEAIKELMKMVPDNAGFAGVLDFEQALKLIT